MAPHGECRADNLSGGTFFVIIIRWGAKVEDFAYNCISAFNK